MTTLNPAEWLRSLRARGLMVFRRARLERDLDDELRFHLAMREEERAAAGLEGDAPRFAALRRFGNPAALKEQCRDLWTFGSLDMLLQDVRFAGRMLIKNPGFTAVAVLSLALGIGANAAMFSLVRAVLLKPLPYPAADRLVRLTGFYPKGAVVALQERSRTMDVAGAGTDVELNLTGHGEAVRLSGSTVSASLFSVLGRGVMLGRTFEPGEGRSGRDAVVLLSHGLWQSRFGGDPTTVGRTITLEGVDRQVVGIMPPDFHFPSAAAQLWIPARLDSANTEDYWGFGWTPMIGRLRDGASVAQAHDELKSLIPEVAKLFPWPATRWNADAAALPLQEDLVRDLRLKLVVLQSAVGIVLLIACANVASLLLSRGAARRQEIALRTALGASRVRVLRQLLTESLVLSVLGGVLGMGLAMGTLTSLKAVLPGDARVFSTLELDPGVLLFVTALSLGCGLVFGVAPAASAARVDLAASMRAAGRRSSAPVSARLRSSFITAEVALAVLLAVGAGLLVRTLWGLTRVDPGFRAAETITARVTPNESACEPRTACVAFYDALLERVRRAGGVAEVAGANALPLHGQEPLLPVEMDGQPLSATDGIAPLLWAGAVTPEYFEVMGIPIVRGRGLERADGERSTPVVLVSAATARRYWPGQDPIGKRIRVVWDQDWRTVVGVVGDVRQYALSGRTPAEITGAMYMPYPQSVALNRKIPTAMALFVKTKAPAGEVAARLRELITEVNPDVPMSEVRRLEAVVSSSVSEPRAMVWLFGSFASCALLLAAIGIYGVVSYSTAQRTYEIGVRVAVGARRADIFGLVVGQSLGLTLVGLGLGRCAALLLGRALSSFLFGVTAIDPLTYASVGALVLLTALMASYLPGRRAAATDPVRALRVE